MEMTSTIVVYFSLTHFPEEHLLFMYYRQIIFKILIRKEMIKSRNVTGHDVYLEGRTTNGQNE